MARFVVTGGAGFIGGHLVETLVNQRHEVVVLDDFSTGHRDNLAAVAHRVEVIEGSVCDRATVDRAMKGATFCLHHAAIASVPRSVADPIETNRVNVEGTLNVYLAARDAGVRRVVVASSSAVYGETDTAPVNEDLPLRPLSPYGVSKAVDELYGAAFTQLYGLDIVALRYFNVFGPRQNPASEYAAVVPKFITRVLEGHPPVIYGSGRQSRDFVFVGNVVAANLQACMAPGNVAGVYNIAGGEEWTVSQLAESVCQELGSKLTAVHEAARPGEIERSWADIGKARALLGYEPEVGVIPGLKQTIAWYRARHQGRG